MRGLANPWFFMMECHWGQSHAGLMQIIAASMCSIGPWPAILGRQGSQDSWPTRPKPELLNLPCSMGNTNYMIPKWQHLHRCVPPQCPLRHTSDSCCVNDLINFVNCTHQGSCLLNFLGCCCCYFCCCCVTPPWDGGVSEFLLLLLSGNELTKTT